MAAYKKINWLIRVIVISLTLTLFMGVENSAVAGKKKPVKTKIIKKKVVPKVKKQTNNDIPKPVVDDTPINPKKPKKGTVSQKKNNAKKNSAKFNINPKKKNKKKRK